MCEIIAPRARPTAKLFPRRIVVREICDLKSVLMRNAKDFSLINWRKLYWKFMLLSLMLKNCILLFNVTARNLLLNIKIMILKNKSRIFHFTIGFTEK